MREGSIRSRGERDADHYLGNALEAMVLTGISTLTPKGMAFLRMTEKRINTLLMRATTLRLTAATFEKAGQADRARVASRHADRIVAALPRFHSFWLSVIVRGFSQ